MNHADVEQVAVLFSAGLDSAVLLAHAARRFPSAQIQPIYVSAGLAWEQEEMAMAQRFLAAQAFSSRLAALVALTVDMRDIYPATHWAIRGEPPAYDTPDEDVYLDGRNVILLSKASVFMARARIPRILIGPLSGNPFPDATPSFFESMAAALSIGLAAPWAVAWRSLRADAFMHAAGGWTTLWKVQQVPRTNRSVSGGWRERSGKIRRGLSSAGFYDVHSGRSVIDPSPVLTRILRPPSPIRPRTVRLLISPASPVATFRSFRIPPSPVCASSSAPRPSGR
jgi:7-cyano-7-deazaguanine synthase in queuosine biosynthesis